MFFTSFPSLLAQKCTKTNLEQSFSFSCSSVPWHQAVLGHSDTVGNGSNLVFTSNLGSLHRKVTSSSFEPLRVQMIVIRHKIGKIFKKTEGFVFFFPLNGGISSLLPLILYLFDHVTCSLLTVGSFRRVLSNFSSYS